MKIIVIEPDRLWEFTRSEWTEFITSVLKSFGHYPSKPKYPEDKMLRCGTPTINTIAQIANNGDVYFAIEPSKWYPYKWQMELNKHESA